MIGTATSALSRSYGVVVPAATVSRVVDALLAHGRVARAWLGIGAQAVGMRAVLVPHSDIPAVQRGHTDGNPDAIVERLADLLAVVDCWR